MLPFLLPLVKLLGVKGAGLGIGGAVLKGGRKVARAKPVRKKKLDVEIEVEEQDEDEPEDGDQGEDSA